ncbi:hypothetical protein [Clostridium botulinum]|uniref:hypothetical protein n=1 Tax=Clostridium botulinum TaxID=1491 RepID=UPI00077350A0|nr:hypothetical protein [Clostridium botulinum]MBY6931272.1 hypothetical protein [Clostridium botulinum]NFG19794.1 hypothetical protein [Clostridium botulinum]NFO79884.1 hypothetical protein [Clostridium botulinum]
MLQYKLFKLHSDNRENTLAKIKGIFGDDNIWVINEKIIAIFYDYGINDYKYVLKQTIQLNISQLIVNSNIILSFMEHVIESNSFITELSFAKTIAPEDNELINKSIRLMNIEKDIEKKKALKKSLFTELMWLTTDGCIDINYIETEIKCDQEKKFIKVKLYNNGVIILQNMKVKNELTYIFKQMKDEM